MRRPWATVVLVVAWAGVTSCGGGGYDSVSGGALDEEPWTASLPPGEWPSEELLDPAFFRVGWVPERFQVEVAGSGVQRSWLSADSEGTIEPSLLLVPDDWDGTDGSVLVWVASADYSGLEGGWGQVGGHYEDDPVPRFEVDGRTAVYNPSVEQVNIADIPYVTWNEVLVDWGDGWALRVAGPEATEDELVDVATRARLVDDLESDEDERDDRDDPRKLPALDSLPDGMRVVSRITPEQIQAADGSIYRSGGDRQVDIYGNAVVWVDRSTEVRDVSDWRSADRLTVASVPGSTANVEAIGWLHLEAGPGDWGNLETVEPARVHGRPALVSRTEGLATLTFTLPDGQLMVVTSTGRPPLTDDDLVRVAESVEPVDEPAWDEYTTELEGGPGLHPDPGRITLIEGEIDGEGWLLQSTDLPLLWGAISLGPGSENMVGGANFPIPAEASPDSCIKLESGSRVCSGGSGGGSLDLRSRYDRYADMSPDSSNPYFEVGLVKPGPVLIRMTTDQRVIEVEPSPLPNTNVRIYLFAFRPGEEPLTREYFDAAGNLIPDDPGF